MPGLPRLENSRFRFMAVTGLIAIWLLAMAGGWHFMFKPPQVPERYADLVGDFTLTSSDGPVALHDFRGHVVDMIKHDTEPRLISERIRKWLF